MVKWQKCSKCGRPFKEVRRAWLYRIFEESEWGPDNMKILAQPICEECRGGE